MPQEIERKFAVLDPSIVEGRWGSRIVQGYIADEPMTVRVRIMEAEAFLTLKGKAVGICRDEFEFPIPIAQAEELIARYCGTRIVAKTRYRIAYCGQVFEVDVFQGMLAGLVLAEIELTTDDQSVDLPSWIGSELTHDRRFSNGALSLATAPPIIDVSREMLGQFD